MAALPIYAKVNKLEKLQNDLAQIALCIPESHPYFGLCAQ
jgi:hypothetical protein